MHKHCESNSFGCNQYCDQFFHNPNFIDYFTNQCVGKKNCAISQVDKFVAKQDENLGTPEICRSSQSRFYIQYECKESQATIDGKRSNSFKMAIFETVGAFLVLFGLIFNSVKTQKMGKQYDELNLTASDYTLYIDVTPDHRSEFEDLYARQLEEEQPRYSRGFLFKQYLEKKLRIRHVEAARVDLVFDNAKMINLLEARGSAIKTENFDAIEECELQIEGLKEFQYNADVVGAFVTYEKNEDIKKVQGVFGGTQKPEEGDGVPPFHA